MKQLYKGPTTNVTASVEYNSPGDEPTTVVINIGGMPHVLRKYTPQDHTTLW